MLLFNKCTEDSDIFSVDESTKDFCVAIFGFFPHSMTEALNEFLTSELGVRCVSDLSEFVFGGSKFVIPYDVCDRRTFDHAYLLPMTFKSQEEARSFIDSAIKNSEWVNAKIFTEIVILDASKLEIHIQGVVGYRNALKVARNKIDDEVKEFRAKLQEKYANDELMMRVIAESPISRNA